MPKTDPFSDLAAELDYESLAQAILRIDTGMKELLQAKPGLKEDTLILLLHDQTGVGKRDISLILNGLAQLKDHYLNT